MPPSTYSVVVKDALATRRTEDSCTLLLSIKRSVMAIVAKDSKDIAEQIHGPDLVYSIDRKPLLSQLDSGSLQMCCGPKLLASNASAQKWLSYSELVFRQAGQLVFAKH